MPWLDASAPPVPEALQWRAVFKNALFRRLTAEELSAPLEELHRQDRLPGDKIAKVLLGFRASGGIDDILLFRYAEHLLKDSYITTADLLSALLTLSTFSGKDEHARLSVRQTGMPSCEERIFTMLAQMHLLGTLAIRTRDLNGTVTAISQWLHVICEHEMGKQLESTGLHTLDPYSFGMYEALASVVVSIFGKHSFRKVAKQALWRERRSSVVQELENFDLHVLQWMQSHFAGRLQALTKMPPLVETDESGRLVINAEHIQSSVTDLPVAHTRAGLYIWLDACLCGRPMTDDLSMLGYLQARYSGDNQTLAVDLLTASFDNLTNSMLRKEPAENTRLRRSFICNKLPLLFAMLAGYIAPPMSIETCIQMAFIGSITMDVLPPISEGDKDVRELLKKTRLEFLQASASQGLISEATVNTILQEQHSLPRITRYNKEGLIAQCTNNISRIEALSDELRAMQGNAGAISGCIVQTISNLCIAKDTMSLKTVCNILIRKVPNMDIVLQYTQPADVLVPLCTLLNEWTHDQDQAEFTPSYEEFASVLLFTLAFVHRYHLTQADAPLLGADNFVFVLLENISSTPELNEVQDSQLSKWTEGLFATDEHGETSGISDDVMRQCPPQDFYRLVPTLFMQSILACKSNQLSAPVLKGGLELLLEPFLLPSLVGGLSWVVKHSWEDHNDVNILLMVLDKLLKPSSSSQETQAMHKAIMTMVSIPLTRSLQELLVRRPEMKPAGVFIELLKPYNQQCAGRIARSNRSEVMAWAGAQEGGLVRAVRSTVRDLTSWIPNNPPPAYDHKLVITAADLAGPDTILEALLAELKDQTAVGNGAQALDVCVAIVCAPDTPAASSRSLSLRDHLRLSTTDSQRLLDWPLKDAEALIRLARRVDAQLSVPQLAQLPLSMPMQDEATDQIMQDLMAEDANVNVTAPMDMDQTSLGQVTASADFGIGLVGSGAQEDVTAMTGDGMQIGRGQNYYDFGDMDQPQQPQGQGGENNEQAQEDDIFAGLDMDMAGMGDLGDDDFN